MVFQSPGYGASGSGDHLTLEPTDAGQRVTMTGSVTFQSEESDASGKADRLTIEPGAVGRSEDHPGRVGVV